MPVIHYHLNVTGLVQGVGFRYSAQAQALKLGLSGHVKNAVDGSVVIEVEGEEEAVNRFREWCRHGPRGAQVAHLECTEGAIQGFESFEITFY